MITLARIPGVTPPATGEKPVETITETDQYTGTVGWSPTVNGVFSASTDYTARITLAAKSGYTLDGVAAGFFSIAGASSVTNAAGSGVVTAEFPRTGALPPAAITIAAIPGVTPPATGGTPVTTITETDQFTGTVSWSPAVSDAFLESTVYSATITLTAKSGYTLNGVAGNWFAVAGASSVTNPAESGVVTAVFPATLVTVSIPAIPGVTAPVLGETPVTTITETAEFTGTVSWDGGWEWSTRFGGQKAYAATITLAAKPGYTFSGVAADSFTVAGATSVTHPADSGVITAVFPATAAVSVGDSVLGGRVAYILKPTDASHVAGEQRGLIVSPQLAQYSPWSKGPFDRTLVSGTGTAIGTGRANTDLIVGQNGPGEDYAAGLARSFSGGGYTDWYLPSRDELIELQRVRGSLGFEQSCYRTSSESDAENTWLVWNDLFLSTESKSSRRSVRAVRNF